MMMMIITHLKQKITLITYLRQTYILYIIILCNIGSISFLVLSSQSNEVNGRRCIIVNYLNFNLIDNGLTPVLGSFPFKNTNFNNVDVTKWQSSLRQSPSFIPWLPEVGIVIVGKYICGFPQATISYRYSRGICTNAVRIAPYCTQNDGPDEYFSRWEME